MGRFEVSELESDDGGMIVKIYGNFFAQAAKSETGNPSCFFPAGLVAGIAEGLFEEDHHCLERQCLASGAEFCEF
jgi:predicted hydrocarbon binding protein